MPLDAAEAARKTKLAAAKRPTLVSIDERWSAFSLRHDRPGEPRQTFR